MLEDSILVSVSETGRILNIGKTKIYELISDGNLVSVKIGSRRLVTMKSVRRLPARLAAAVTT